MVKWVALIIIAAFVAYVLYWSWRFRNPYKLYFIFGRKGCGKSTFIQKWALKYLKKGWTVYSNTPVAGGVYLYNPQDIGQLNFKPNSVVFCDEVSTIFHNRDFKSMRKDTRDFFAYCRHRRIVFYAFSQTFNNADKVIRDQCDRMYIMSNFLNCMSIGRLIKKGPRVYSNNEAGEDHIGDSLTIMPWILAPFGSVLFTWIPKYAKYFDSFEAEPLPLDNFVYYDARKDLYHVTLFARLSAFFRDCLKRIFNRERYQDDSDMVEVSGAEFSVVEISEDAEGAGQRSTGA